VDKHAYFVPQQVTKQVYCLSLKHFLKRIHVGPVIKDFTLPIDSLL
jgi:hypothetical protein